MVWICEKLRKYSRQDFFDCLWDYLDYHILLTIAKPVLG
jgi:hypothetical protein